jgi:ppGpp synthetase/RelA/SpoT-type nucleotidyltranferase
MPSEGNELELRAHKVCAPAQAALTELLRAFQLSDIGIFYLFKSRAKSVERTIEKVLWKRKEKDPLYEPEKITDIVGLRVVTLFREDVIEALKVILQAINHEGRFETYSPLARRVLREKIIYTTAGVGDPEALLTRLSAVFDAMGHPTTEEDISRVPTSYSSIHLVAEVVVQHETALKSVPVEFQIRTVFEDAWGEIDHKLRYSLNRSRTQPAVLETWQPHLNVLKYFVDGCGQYAGVIKQQAIDPGLHPRFDLQPFVSVDTVEEAFSQMGTISDKLKAAFEEAYSNRWAGLQIQESLEGQSEVGREHLLKAAEQFAIIANSLRDEEFESARASDAAFFFSRMERAFCLLSTGNKPDIDQAIQIYNDMRVRSPKSVIVFYRLAQSLARLGEFESAAAMYERAEHQLSEDEHVPEGHWLWILVPLQSGYIHWTKSLGVGSENSTEKKRLLILAYEKTKLARSRSANGTKYHVRASNNLLYYAVSYRTLCSPAETEQIPIDELLSFITEIESSMPVETATLDERNWLDTLCRSYVHLNDWKKARPYAERLETLLTEMAVKRAAHIKKAPENSSEDGADPPPYGHIVGNLNDRERDIFDHALWVLRKTDTSK